MPAVFRTNERISIAGYFQYLPTIKDIVPTVCDDLKEYVRCRADTLREKYDIRAPHTTGFIHVRRGDYLAAPDHHSTMPPAYYINAMNYISHPLGAVRRWLVLSDDTDWCEEQAAFMDCEVLKEPDELDGLAIMSLCVGGAIIGNSTYSWWGAMMGAHAAGNQVVYPSKWSLGSKQPDLFPSVWIPIN